MVATKFPPWNMELGIWQRYGTSQHDNVPKVHSKCLKKLGAGNHTIRKAVEENPRATPGPNYPSPTIIWRLHYEMMRQMRQTSHIKSSNCPAIAVGAVQHAPGVIVNLLKVNKDRDPLPFSFFQACMGLNFWLHNPNQPFHSFVAPAPPHLSSPGVEQIAWPGSTKCAAHWEPQLSCYLHTKKSEDN